MKTAAVLLAALGPGCRRRRRTSSHLTDVDYLKVNRCRGLAEGLGLRRRRRLDALIKNEGRSRVETIYTKGQEELSADGKRRREPIPASGSAPN